MPNDAIKIEIVGLDKLMKALQQFPNEARHSLKGAGEEASRDVILKTPGLGGLGQKTYPPAPPGSKPPIPYYQRGVGMIYLSGKRATSEKLGTLWTVKSTDYKTTIGNSASYAKWVIGEQQAQAMKRIGWKRLYQTAVDKQADLQKVYQKWINALIKKLNL